MSAARFIVFKPDTGEILRTGSCAPATVELQAKAGEAVILGLANDSEHYINDGAILPRPSVNFELSAASVPADGVTPITLSGVPSGAVVRVGTAEAIADGGPIEITTDLLGENIVRVEAFPAKEWRGVFDGT